MNKTPVGLPEILFVHGGWHGPWCWDNLADRFDELGYDVRTVWLRGHGRRAWRIRHRIGDYVEDVRQAASRCATPPVLVGHSLGGLIAAKYLEQAPAAAGLVLLAPVPSRGGLSAICRLGLRYPLALLKATLALRLRPFVRTPEQVRDLFFTSGTGQQTVDATWSRLTDESYLAFLQSVVVRPRPDRIHVPVMLIAADRDRFFTLAEMTQTARAYGTDAVVIEGSGHNLMLDDNWPEVARHIRRWIDATIPDDGGMEQETERG